MRALPEYRAEYATISVRLPPISTPVLTPCVRSKLPFCYIAHSSSACKVPPDAFSVSCSSPFRRPCTLHSVHADLMERQMLLKCITSQATNQQPPQLCPALRTKYRLHAQWTRTSCFSLSPRMTTNGMPSSSAYWRLSLKLGLAL